MPGAAASVGKSELFAWDVGAVTLVAAASEGDGCGAFLPLPRLERGLRSLFLVAPPHPGSAAAPHAFAEAEAGARTEAALPPPPPGAKAKAAPVGGAGAVGESANVHGRAPVVRTATGSQQARKALQNRPPGANAKHLARGMGV